MGRNVKVLSSDGVTHYDVPVGDDGKAGPCVCKAAQHGNKCRHLGEAERLDAQERKREAAK